MRPRQLFAGLTLALGLVSLLGGSVHAQPSNTVQSPVSHPGPIDIVEVEGIIDPPTARYITDRLAAAQEDGAQLVILRLDSPADVSVNRERLLRTVADASVPVVAWIAPRGAVAEGVARALFVSADVSFEASNAQLLDATPAHSLSEVLQALDGTTIGNNVVESWDDASGTPGVLLRFQEMPVWDRLLHAVTTPTAALFLILLGAFGLIFETYNPGIGLAAGIGVALLGLGFYALDVLPTNWWALLIITASIIGLIYEVHVAGFGVFTIGGLAGVAVGSALLFPGDVAALDLNIGAIIAAVVLTIIFFVSVMTAALRVRLRRPIDDSEGIVGSIAEAQTDIAPEGTVISNGTVWRARTMETGIAAGARVEVKATEGLVLLVEPLHEDRAES